MKLHLSASLLFASLGVWASASAHAANKTVTDAQTTTTVEESYDGITVEGGSASLTVSDGGSLTATGMTEMKNGGSIIIDGGSLTTQQLMLHNLQTNTGESFILKNGVVTVTGTNKTLPGTNDGGQNTVVIGHWGSGNSNTRLSIEGGTFNALDGLVVVSWTSQGKLDISGGVANMYGVSIAGQPNIDMNSTLNLSGTGVLNLGAGGLQSKASSASKTVNMNGGTLGVLDSDWNADANVKLNLGGDVVVDTARTVAGSGEAQAIGSGATVTFLGTISGSGTMEKTGAGSLLISGTVSGSGKTFKATNGTLDFAGSSLASGNTFQLNGGEIANLTLQLGNTLTQTAGTSGTLSNLTLSGGTVSFAGLDGASYSLTGTLALGAITTLDFAGSTGYADGTTLFSGVTFGEGFTWNDDEWARYFTLTGTEENWKIVYDQDGNVFKLAANSAAQLTWDNAAGTGMWNTTDANWGDASATFRSGDAATFSGTTGTVTVDAAGVLASKVTVTNASGFVLAGGSVTGPVNIDGASCLTVDTTVTGAISLTGSSTLTVGSAGTLDAVMTFGDAESKLVLTKTNAFASTATVVGSGIIEVNWGTQTGNVNAQLANFNGTLQISGGRYEGGNTALGASSIVVTDGGQLYLTGGTWNQQCYLAGSGWTSSADAGKEGSLRLDTGARITGEVHLTDHTTINVNSGTGTIASAVDGAGKTLTKVGTGTLKLDSATSAIGFLDIQKGTVQLATPNATYGNIGRVTIGDRATLQIGNEFGISFTCADITINGGGALRMLNANSSGVNIGTDSGKIIINASEEKHAVIAGTWGGTTNIKSLVTGNGVFELQNGEEGGSAYTNPMRFKNTISDQDGKLALLQTGGRYHLDHANTYSGGTTVSGGTMYANADNALGTGDVEIREGGAVQANGVTLSNNISVKNAPTNEAPVPETRATIAKRGSAAGVRYDNTKIDGTGISSTAASKASLSHAVVNVEKTYSLSSVTLVDSLVTIQAAGVVTLTNVAVGAGSAVNNTVGGTATMAGTANAVTMSRADVKVADSLTSYTPSGAESPLTFVGVTTSQLNGVSLTDGANITIDLTNDLLCSSALAGHQYLAVTFEGLTGANALTADNFTLSDHLTAGFAGAGVLGAEATSSGGTVVYIGFAPNSMPEPTSSMLALVGFSGLLLRRRRKS